MSKLIELDAAIAETWKDTGYTDPLNVMTALRDRLEALPTVDAVPVMHGHWIDIDTETYTWKIRCSHCSHERSMMSTGKTYPMYCENCGAKMDGKGNGNETD